MSTVWDSAKDYYDSIPQWGKALIGVTAVAGSTYLLFFYSKTRKSPYKTDYKKDVVYLYQFPRAAAVVSLSPYAIKLETWLRMNNITYENVETPMWLRSREGLLPFVEFNGIEYPDSGLIIRNLGKLLKKEGSEATLPAEQIGASRAFEQMMENSTFWSYGYVRYVEKAGELFSEKIMGWKMPLIFRLLYPVWRVQKMMTTKLFVHGIGRHGRDDIISIGLDDLRAVSSYLGSKQFMHGDKPTRVDATMFGFLSQIVYVPIMSAHKDLMTTECQNLIRYCDRVKARFWPDWDEICRTRALNTWKK